MSYTDTCISKLHYQLYQGPFDAIFCKLLDFYEKHCNGEQVEEIETLNKYYEESKSEVNPNGALILEGAEMFKNLYYRFGIHQKVEELFSTPIIQDICSNHGKSVKRPRSVLIEASKNEGIDDTSERYPIEEEIKEAGLSYPVILKTNRAFFTPLSHAKFFIPDPTTLDSNPFSEVYQNTEFMSEDIIVEELVPHDEKELFKVHFMSSEFMFSRVEKSVPKEFHTEFRYIGKNVHRVDKTSKELEDEKEEQTISKCSKFDELDANEKFLYEIGQEILSVLGTQFSGFDFVIDTNTNEFVLIDANYFTLFKKCNPDRVKECFNTALTNLVTENRK